VNLRVCFHYQWRNKTDAEKNVYAERAREVNRKRGAQIEECVDPDEVPTPSKRPWELTDEDLVTLKRLKLKQGRDWIYECQWSECDLEFEDVVDLIVHCTYQPDGHACLSFVGTNHMGEFHTFHFIYFGLGSVRCCCCTFHTFLWHCLRWRIRMPVEELFKN